MASKQQFHTTDNVSAAQTRVTPEELSRAIAVIEARQQEEQQHLAGTLEIGAAVQDLQLGVSPEEILAEVETQRRQSTELIEEPINWLPLKIFGTLGAIVVIFFALGVALHMQPARPMSQYVGQPINSYSRTLPNASANFMSTVIMRGYRPAGSEPFVNSPYHLLSSIRDNIPFGCSVYTTGQILSGKPETLINIYDAERDRTYRDWSMPVSNPTDYRKIPGPYLFPAWVAIKHNKHVYLRGFIAGSDAAPGQVARALHLFNTRNAPELAGHPLPVTVPVNGTKFGGLYSRYINPYGPTRARSETIRPYEELHHAEQVTLFDVRFDAHAHERW